MGHLHPDLVPPAGQKPDLNQTPSPAFFQNPVGQAAFLRSRRIRRTDAGPVLPGVLRQVIHQHAFFFRKFSTYQGPIPFFHTCVIRCLSAQIRRRITIFRHQQDPLHRLVQPVHQPELYLLPPQNHLILEHAHQIGNCGPGALRGYSRRFIYCQKVFVFI